MNNAMQIFRRLLTFRGCNRIISYSFCDCGKVNISNGKKNTSHDTSDVSVASSQVKQINEVENKTSSTTFENERTSSETLQQSETNVGYEKLSIGSKNDIGESGERRQGDSPAPGEENCEVTSNTKRKEAERSKFGEGAQKKSWAEPGDFLAAFKNHEEFLNKQLSEDELPPSSKETFASLFRKSPFVDMGDPIGKIVVGEIFLVVDNDLYIDFGWKFHAVCNKPQKNPEIYVAGARVFLRINDLELNAKFLGETRYISLLEADCRLVGIALGKEKEPQKYGKRKG